MHPAFLANTHNRAHKTDNLEEPPQILAVLVDVEPDRFAAHLLVVHPLEPDPGDSKREQRSPGQAHESHMSPESRARFLLFSFAGEAYAALVCAVVLERVPDIAVSTYKQRSSRQRDVHTSPVSLERARVLQSRASAVVRARSFLARYVGALGGWILVHQHVLGDFQVQTAHHYIRPYHLRAGVDPPRDPTFPRGFNSEGDIVPFDVVGSHQVLDRDLVRSGRRRGRCRRWRCRRRSGRGRCGRCGRCGRWLRHRLSQNPNGLIAGRVGQRDSQLVSRGPSGGKNYSERTRPIMIVIRVFAIRILRRLNLHARRSRREEHELL
mmetsp:Transcript_2189/g.2946  ORF Transcript_2189/g.2946 Transcript_2189/m.2946 type:complete len:323 (+) Transcript_2189:523-1491(+)